MSKSTHPEPIPHVTSHEEEAAWWGKHATPHTLRHTFASAKSRRGVPLRQVQEWLGHKSIATTQRYVHLDRQDAQKLMEATSL